MDSSVFQKILYRTTDIQNIKEHNRECIHLFFERFSFKQDISKILNMILKENLSENK